MDGIPFLRSAAFWTAIPVFEREGLPAKHLMAEAWLSDELAWFKMLRLQVVLSATLVFAAGTAPAQEPADFPHITLFKNVRVFDGMAENLKGEKEKVQAPSP